jgi:hypothetical protein
VKATEIPIRTVDVVSAYLFQGIYFLETAVSGYDGLKDYPSLVTFEGRKYERTGWNSDTNIVYFRSYPDSPQVHAMTFAEYNFQQFLKHLGE